MAIWRVKRVADEFSVSESTIWRWSKNGFIPPPLKLGPRVTGWRSTDIKAVINTKIKG